MSPLSRLALVLFVSLGVALLLFGSDTGQAVQQPLGLWFPWEGGKTWRYTNGPHGASVDGFGHAVDLQPPDAGGKACDSFVSSYWVTASAAGTVINKLNGLEIDHGGGFRTGYLHLQEKVITSGRVEAGERLGRPACCPDGDSDRCWATAPHLHFYTTQRGQRQGLLGLSLEGWGMEDDGCFSNGDKRVCTGGYLKSNAPPPPALSSTDVVIVIDRSSTASATQSVALANAYLAASRSGDRASIVTFDGVSSDTLMLREALRSGRIDAALSRALGRAASPRTAAMNDRMEKMLLRRPRNGSPTNAGLSRGLFAACRELARTGAGDNAGILLISGGSHLPPVTARPERCLAGRWPVFTVGLDTNAEVLLMRLAKDTNGDFLGPDPAKSHACDWQRIRTLIGDGKPASCQEATLAAEQPAAIEVKIPAGQSKATISVNWFGSGGGASPGSGALSVVLTAPTGKVVSAKAPGVDFRRETTLRYDAYTIYSPSAGTWTVRVTMRTPLATEVLVTVSASTHTAPPVRIPSATPTPTPDEAAIETPTAVEESPSPGDSPTETTSPTPKASRIERPTPTDLPVANRDAVAHRHLGGE